MSLTQLALDKNIFIYVFRKPLCKDSDLNAHMQILKALSKNRTKQFELNDSYVNAMICL